MKNLDFLQSSEIETNLTPATEDRTILKTHRGEKKKVGSFMRRDKRKNTKMKELPSHNEKTSN